jgi:hypothetical protein
MKKTRDSLLKKEDFCFLGFTGHPWIAREQKEKKLAAAMAKSST